MNTFSLKENGKGNFDIKDFGKDVAGPDGNTIFTLVIKSENLPIDLQIAEVTAAEMFSRLDTKGDHYRRGIYFSTDYVTVETITNLYLLNVKKAFFNLIKCRYQEGKVKNQTSKAIVIKDSSNAILFIEPSEKQNQSAA